MKVKDPNLEFRQVRCEQDRLGAERLRYRVFVEELGGDGPLVDHGAKFERDGFDPYCEQLILVDKRRDAALLDHVVGVYRLLDQDGADRAGQFYSETEYDLSVLRRSGRKLLELGRSCVLVDYRNSLALFLLWQGLAEYVQRHRYGVLFGVASFPGVNAARFEAQFSYLHRHHLAPAELRMVARPDCFLAMDTGRVPGAGKVAIMRVMPPLVKAYLRIGGFVGDGAFVDRVFNTTDVCLVVDVARMSERQRRLYTGSGT